MYTYVYRNELNIEYLEIMVFIKKLPAINCMLLIYDKNKYYNEEDTMENIIEDIKEYSNETNEKIDKL